MNASAIRAIDAVRFAIRAAGMPSSEERDRQIAESLSLLTQAMGASRACLCIVGVGLSEDVVERVFTGGDPAVLPVGPALLGVPLRQIPDFAVVLDADVGCVVIETPKASDDFTRIFDGLKFDWVAGNALRDGDAVISVLFLVGRGEAPDPAELPCRALSAFSEAMRPVIRASFPAAVNESIKLQTLSVVDSLGLGLVMIDNERRVRSVNHVAETMLGATSSELQGKVLSDACLDVQSIDGTAVTQVVFPKLFEPSTKWICPFDLQIRNRAGRTVLFRVAVGPLAWSRAFGGERRAVILMELTDTDDLASPAEVADPQADFVGLLTRLRTTLDELEKLRGTLSPARGLPAAFDALTARETEIVSYLLDGVRVSTIAECVYLSPHTVRNHLRSIFKKLGVTSQAELIRLARGLG